MVKGTEKQAGLNTDLSSIPFLDFTFVNVLDSSHIQLRARGLIRYLKRNQSQNSPFH
jgi:hypothetical protein